MSRNAKKRPAKAASLDIKSRHRPTLPPPLEGSTIGAGGLNFRVRDGTGCDPSAVGTETIFSCLITALGSDFSPTTNNERRHLLPSPRPISTGQLNALLRFHLRPINPVFWLGALPG